MFAALHRHGRGTRRVPGQQNRVEKAYAAHLETLKRTGEIQWYAFEAWKMRLADNTFITPDFIVMAADGTIEAHDTKGAKKKPNGEPGYWCEEDAKIKLKVLAEMHPVRVFIVYPAAGGWRREEL